MTLVGVALICVFLLWLCVMVFRDNDSGAWLALAVGVAGTMLMFLGGLK